MEYADWRIDRSSRYVLSNGAVQALAEYWLMGSLSGAKWSDLQFVALPMAAGLIPLWLLR